MSITLFCTPKTNNNKKEKSKEKNPHGNNLARLYASVYTNIDFYAACGVYPSVRYQGRKTASLPRQRYVTVTQCSKEKNSSQKNCKEWWLEEQHSTGRENKKTTKQKKKTTRNSGNLNSNSSILRATCYTISRKSQRSFGSLLSVGKWAS